MWKVVEYYSLKFSVIQPCILLSVLSALFSCSVDITIHSSYSCRSTELIHDTVKMCSINRCFNNYCNIILFSFDSNVFFQSQILRNCPFMLYIYIYFMSAFNRRVINLRNVQFVDGRFHKHQQLIIFRSLLFLYGSSYTTVVDTALVAVYTIL